MSTLLQRILVALGRRGVQTPIDQTLGNAYRALRKQQDSHPSVFAPAAEILLAEVEGGATTVDNIPTRIAHLTQMLDRLHREEQLEAWASDNEEVVIVS